MSVYFFVDWDGAAVPQGLHSTDAIALDPTVPFSVQLWVRMVESGDRPPTGFQTVWWYGNSDDSDGYIELVFLNNSRELRLRVGDSYPGVPAVTSDAPISMNEWHLVTIVVSHTGSQIKHEMFVDAQAAESRVLNSGSPPDVSTWDRFALGRSGKVGASAVPSHCMVEQAAIWTSRALTQSEHATVYSDDDAAFDGLRRSPDVLGGSTFDPPSLAWWMLTGHHRHVLRVQNDQSAAEFGELSNEGNGAPPSMALLSPASGKDHPTWSVESPLVYYPPQAVGALTPRPPKRAPHRRSPRFAFYQKPELFTPWNQPANLGKHPVYNDPNCVVLSRIAFNNVNSGLRSPPVFIDETYTPQTYVTNVARRIADWFEFQGFWSVAAQRRAS